MCEDEWRWTRNMLGVAVEPYSRPLRLSNK
jgi:hypothetical protein